MIYGYCRISTTKQNLDRQRRNILAAYPDAQIITETYTGTTMDRREWDKLMHRVKPGDTIVFDSVSRMSRNAAEGFSAYQQLYSDDVNLVFLKEPHINTDVYRKALTSQIKMTGDKVDLILEGVNKYLMELAKEQIRIAFDQAQKEVDDLSARTKEGMETARLAGKQIGRERGTRVTTKKELKAKKIILQHSRSFGGSLNDEDCRKLAGVSRNTYYKYKAELRNEEAPI